MNEFSPKILVFSTDNVSDPGIDLAGRNKMHYPATVFVITIPCSSGIKPAWIVHALENGFDGVFIAADGSDCALVSDCTARTAKTAAAAQARSRSSRSSRRASRWRRSARCAPSRSRST